jgi:tetratricopeptide (TPR) repeat protein
MPTIAEALAAAARLHEGGNLAEAERLYREVVQADPRQAVAWHNLGLLARQRGQAASAIELMTRSIQLEPGQPTFHNNLGAMLQSQSRPAEAATCYARALQLKPDYADAHCNLGSAYKDQGRVAEAIACYTRALEHNPELAEAHFNLGVLYQEQGQFDKAESRYRLAIRARPAYAEAYNNLGALYKRQDNLADAMTCYSRALEFRPNFAEPLNNLGNIFHTQGRVAEALVCYEQSLRINPRYAQAHYNRAVANLAAGNLAEGWAEYEWRWRCPDFRKPAVNKPRWDERPLDSRVLLVTAEQGLGDTLQFIRYLPLVEERFGRAIAQVQTPLVPLLRASGFGNVVGRDEASGHYDAYIPLLSLAGVFETRLDTVPAKIPYLSANQELVARWREALGTDRRFRVGIAWQGSPTYRGDRFRSIPLAHFAPLAQEGVELVSLQKGPGVDQLAGIEGQFAVRDFGDQLDGQQGPFMDTAAIMMNLDLVVTSDSAVAHLAGALGVNVWLALPITPDWRWLSDRDDSPWYPTMRLFRQTTFDNWTEVFARIADELRNKVGGR